MLRSRIAPERVYPFGNSAFATDGLPAEFSIAVPRMGIMDFGISCQRLVATPSKMRQLARLLRVTCTSAFGVMTFDRVALPIKVIANKKKGVMELRWPDPCERLAAQPEVWLALAEAIDTTAATMPA
jgi:hypothetical protein